MAELQQALADYTQLKDDILERTEDVQQFKFLYNEIKVEKRHIDNEYSVCKENLKHTAADVASVEILIERLQQRKQSMLNQLSELCRQYDIYFKGDSIRAASFLCHQTILDDLSSLTHVTLEPQHVGQLSLVKGLKFVKKWLKSLSGDEAAKHFWMPIDTVLIQFKDYQETVLSPISLVDISERVGNSFLKLRKLKCEGEYYTSFLQVIHDIYKLFNNFYLYNGKSRRFDHRRFYSASLSLEDLCLAFPEMWKLVKNPSSKLLISDYAVILEFRFCIALREFLASGDGVDEVDDRKNNREEWNAAETRKGKSKKVLHQGTEGNESKSDGDNLKKKRGRPRKDSTD